MKPDHLPAWMPRDLDPIAADFARREVDRTAEAVWRPTALERLHLRVFEYVPGDAPRLSAQLRASDGGAGEGIDLGYLPGAELLVQSGSLELDGRRYAPGHYLRLPVRPGERARPVSLHDDALVYLSIGQIEPTDTEERIIDTRDASRWLHGPAEGIEVLPLHGHRSGNAMLVRWLGPGAFRTSLDPVGEEVLVLVGELHDTSGRYLAGGWIRNPVPAWQSWAGTPGTLICYKSGHFATLPDADDPPDTPDGLDTPDAPDAPDRNARS